MSENESSAAGLSRKVVPYSLSVQKKSVAMRLLLSSLFAGLFLLRWVQASQPGSVSDAFFACAFSALAFFLWAFPVVTHLEKRANRIFSFKIPIFKNVLFLVMACVFWGVISLKWSWNDAQSFRALALVTTPAAAFLGVMTLSSSERWRVVFAGALGGALQALNGMFQVFWLWPDALSRREELELMPSIVTRMQEGRALGMSVSPDLFGALCLAGLFCAVALFLKYRQEEGDAQENSGSNPFYFLASMPLLITGVLAVFCLGGVLISRSAGTLIASGFGIGVVLLGFASIKSILFMLKSLGAFLGVAAAGIGILFFLRGADALFLSLHERWLNWEVATRIFVENPLGVGLHRFAPAYLQMRTPAGNITRYAHSMWMQGVAELGMGFLLLATLSLMKTAEIVVYFFRKHRKENAIAFVFFGAALAATLRASLDYDLQIAQTATSWALLWALFFSFALEESSNARADNDAELHITKGFSTRSVFVLLFLLGITSLNFTSAWHCFSFEKALYASENEQKSNVLAFSSCEGALILKRAQDLLYAPLLEKKTDSQVERRKKLTILLDYILPKEGAAVSSGCAHLPAMVWRIKVQQALFLQDLPAARYALENALRTDPGHAAAHQLCIRKAEQAIDLDTLEQCKKEALRWISKSELHAVSWEISRQQLYGR